jgi:predicted lipoprotein with Yx(FWY)xxD motif
MNHSKGMKFGAAAAVLGLAAAAALAFGSGSGAATNVAAKRTVVKLRKTSLGWVLVDSRGRTLYMFEKDEFGRSACYGKCAVAWPPLVTTAEPRAGKGVRATLLGTTRRKGGKLQVTYAGYPLYFFVEDAKAGQTRGQDLQGFGGGWYVLDAKGRKIEDGHHGGEPAELEARTTALGRILVDGRGRTLYLYTPDKGKTSVCYGKCAAAWPPLLTTGKPHAGKGTRAARLETTKRKDGSLQVTYHGHPLYYFVEDERAGQTAGQGLGNVWYVLSPAGAKREKTAPATTTTTTTTTTDDSGGGGIYG